MHLAFSRKNHESDGKKVDAGIRGEKISKKEKKIYILLAAMFIIGQPLREMQEIGPCALLEECYIQMCSLSL